VLSRRFDRRGGRVSRGRAGCRRSRCRAPGPRDYHAGYYAAFLLDPEGNKVEAVFHRAAA
jgi:hypothetical protein